MSNVNADLEVLSEKHAREVSALTDRAIAAVSDSYATIAKAKVSDRYSWLETSIRGCVDGARRAARDAAATHMLEELRAVCRGRGVPSVDIARNPLPSDVTEYVNNAVTAARQADEAGVGIESTSWCADRIVESEAFRTYEHARHVAEDSLAELSDEDAERYGFQIATSTSQFKDVREHNREHTWEGLIPLLGKRWSAVNDSQTCSVCKSAHGELAVVGSSFNVGDPPAHARCRCISHLWAVGYVKGENSMGEQLTRYSATIDDREVDDVSRIVRGTASDESIDSHNSIIKADGWDLAQFKRNPVLLWMHRSGGSKGAEPEDVLGKVKAEVKGKKLAVELHFSPEGKNPKADLVFGQIKRGEINALSVGFVPTQYRFEKLNEESDEETLVIEKQRLVELSVVVVGSNNNALFDQVRMLAPMSDASEVVAPTTNTFEGSRVMSDTTIAALPTEVAVILGTTNVDEAKQMIARDRLRIEQLEIERDEANTRAKAATDALDTYRNEAADSSVSELVSLGLIKEESRSTAQTFARSDLAGFLRMYADERAKLAKRDAPKAALLETVVSTKLQHKPQAMPLVDFTAALRSKVRELRSATPSLSLEEAYQLAGELMTKGGK